MAQLRWNELQKGLITFVWWPLECSRTRKAPEVKYAKAELKELCGASVVGVDVRWRSVYNSTVRKLIVDHEARHMCSCASLSSGIRIKHNSNKKSQITIWCKRPVGYVPTTWLILKISGLGCEFLFPWKWSCWCAGVPWVWKCTHFLFKDSNSSLFRVL